MADDEEYVQLTIPEVFVYKVPPRTSAQGHKCVGEAGLRRWWSAPPSRTRGAGVVATAHCGGLHAGPHTC
jgi:hypothetical protein